MDRASLSSRSVQWAFLALAAAAWYVATETGSVSRLFLPPPREVGTALVALVQTSAFWSAVLVTATTVAKAYILALIAGILAGYLVSRSKLAVATIEPVISGLFTIPITLFFPMFILFFGVGTGSKVAYGATYAFFPIALNTIAAFAKMEQRYLLAAQSMGGNRWQIFRYVLMPGALPVLFTGLRIGFFICLASVLGGETISSVAGVGRNIALTAELMEPGRMFAWISFVVCMSVVLNLLAFSFENRIRSR
ncbi:MULTISPECIES: ABC transporter permease subunit [unclassified Beijerinckia]|uniref:ABC transporter permease n=1 Tax=unclassified Beijerinckia TaxID=2638183 RepID=UPI00089ADE66|nr:MULTISPECIES: ABC transporter permease subunit [unclassified Beijerinckia]MDH7799395.1 ABC-type nitrate/sulfonate/bicarbonate transport system permease component [Beijerinckia sp. GAS462]SED48899.1 NitT/TauT family transport system permease protein/sulfonate transport system permease protein [Beijerinckia sp. 28-YEA-48]